MMIIFILIVMMLFITALVVCCCSVSSIADERADRTLANLRQSELDNNVGTNKQ